MRQDLFRGHLETLVLAVLADGPRHGYAISQELAARSDGVLSYPPDRSTRHCAGWRRPT